MSEPIVRRILITNDDGINAPGLAVLERIARNLAEEVWVVAPEHDRSGAGQSISLHSPLRLYAQDDSDRRFALSGTPADCVLFAMAEWFGETPPDLVLSGVNCGANISDSVQYSGTVGAVLTAQHMGVPAMALSQAFLNRDGIDWSPVELLGESVIRSLWAPDEHPQPCWNINFPACNAEAVSEVRWARQSSGSIQRTRLLPGQDGRSLPYWWLSFERSSKHIIAPDMDVTVLRDQAVAVTPLRSQSPLPGGPAAFAIESV
ncbi:5'/3'-nucleotidase SurE [Marinobacter sp. NFXS9]|uniref:5'/3'-nucleotidase SurE n=1 Tax=Marinobacter sp. NFXS9 TaxID=2818433 RepID=UPI0032DEA159